MIHKYLKNCIRLFPVYGKYERQFIKRLKQQIKEYIAEVPNITYETILEQFGTPKEIVLSYYDSVSDDYLLKKTNLVKNIRRFLLVIIIVCIGFFTYRTYIVYQSYLDAKDSTIIHEDSTIEELK